MPRTRVGFSGRSSQPPPHQLGEVWGAELWPPSVCLHFIDARWLFLAFQNMTMFQPPNHQ